MPREWVLTVSSLTTSFAAIARLDRPATSSDSTSLSRWVSPRCAPGQNSPRCSRAADSATRPASDGSMSTSPSRIRRR